MLDKKRIESLIEKGEIKKALDLLPNTQEGLSLKAQFAQLEKETMLNIIGSSDATIARNKIVSAILQLLDILGAKDMETDTGAPPSQYNPARKTDFAAIEKAYKTADYATVLELLDEHFGDDPTPQYSTLRGTIEYHLLQGAMPPPATLQGLRLLINQLKKG